MVWTLNSDLSINTFSYLSSVDLLNISLVSKNFYKQSASNFCWQPLLSKLWCDKVFIQPRIRQLATEYAKLAYFISIADSKRSFMTQEEVSYFTFSFRFKEAAGTEWTNICPWNNGHEASKVSFNVDGSAIRIPSNRPDSSIHMAIESMYSGFRMNWVLRRRHQRSLRKSTPFQYFYALNQVIETYIIDNNSQTNIHSSEYNKDLNSFAVPISNDSVPHDEQQSVNLSNSKIRKISSQSMSTGSQEERSAKHRSSSTELNWLTIFKNCMNSTFCTPDSYLNSVGENLQLLINGTLVPTYQINRSPTGNWGFTMESCWAFYTSFPMPLKGECPKLEDENLEVGIMSQWMDVQLYNNHIIGAVADEEEEDDEDDM